MPSKFALIYKKLQVKGTKYGASSQISKYGSFLTIVKFIEYIEIQCFSA